MFDSLSKIKYQLKFFYTFLKRDRNIWKLLSRQYSAIVNIGCKFHVFRFFPNHNSFLDHFLKQRKSTGKIEFPIKNFCTRKLLLYLLPEKV